MARWVLTLVGGCVCGLGAALALSYAFLMFGPDLPDLLDF
jgi:hypothetical protein